MLQVLSATQERSGSLSGVNERTEIYLRGDDESTPLRSVVHFTETAMARRLAARAAGEFWIVGRHRLPINSAPFGGTRYEDYRLRFSNGTDPAS
jgi:hypothetical protein